jgi:hypothetical protein
MDTATILELILSAVVIALLAWFEINSRRHEQKTESKSTLAKSGLETLKKKSQTELESDTQKKKAA